MIYVGIDPGKSGGIVTLFPDNSVQLKRIPLIGKDIDVRNIREHFKVLSEFPNVKFVLENVHAIPSSSAAAMFTFGFVNGVLQALIEAYDFPYTKVAPKKWQSVAFEGIPKNKDTKAMAAQAAYRLFPNVSFKKMRSDALYDGLVDAALIAYYGRVANL